SPVPKPTMNLPYFIWNKVFEKAKHRAPANSKVSASIKVDFLPAKSVKKPPKRAPKAAPRIASDTTCS
ncbi:hypothetical protein, partial [Listeria monocytogenes]|uniref:hypothetical protein n=1 Tax=Listeria monocytogenes TaxID=1639 RepID=UPI002FDBBAEC